MNTIDFFKEICNIPRESGNEEAIANYLCDFAKKRNLYYKKDKYNNVLIKKQTKNCQPLILQAHTDMVCEKEQNYQFDFKKNSIECIIENGYIRANKTTLGADNGIGIAQILNILNSGLKVNIEAVFTSSEETTMIGAMNFDKSLLKGKSLLSLDGFEEKTIINESACFYDLIAHKENEFNIKYDNYYILTVNGLLGGHSGFDINKNHGNAIILLAQMLKSLNNFNIIDFYGGTKFNVIPSEACCKFHSNLPLSEIKKLLNNFNNLYNSKYTIEEIKKSELGLNNDESLKFINFICEIPNGVINLNKSIPTTSSNLGVVNLKNNEIKIGFRSSRKIEEKNFLSKLKDYLNNYGYELIIQGYQPGFETKNSKLIETLLKTSPYENTIVAPVHITVELGFFKEKIDNLDVAIISPNIKNAHSVNECVEIESILKTDKWLEDFIKSYQK